MERKKWAVGVQIAVNLAMNGGSSGRFNTIMMWVCLPLLAAAAFGLAMMPGDHWKAQVEACLIGVVLTLIPTWVFHDLREMERRDAALVLSWLVFMEYSMASAAPLAALMRLPLRDDLFARADTALGFYVPSITGWFSYHHAALALSEAIYVLIYPLLWCACLIPALGGKRDSAQRFALSNAIAFVVSIPLFTLLPAVGPWFGYHSSPIGKQALCESSILALRSGLYSQNIGILCFPSFHTIWAILSAAPFWSNKWLRLPTAILAALIVASTVTTGWHYAVDTIAGIMIAFASLACADWLLQSEVPFPSRLARAHADDLSSF